MDADPLRRTTVKRLTPLIVAALLGGSCLAQIRQIPPLRGESFSGEAVTLPAALNNRPGILVLGFSQESRDVVTRWGTRLFNDPLASTPVPYYELPVLASVPRLLRGIVSGRIRADVVDAGKPHVIPLFDHEAEWRALAHYTAPEVAYVLLIDGQGTVRWQTQGPPTDAVYAALRHELASLEASLKHTPAK